MGSRIGGIDWYQNEWPSPLFRGYLRSRQPLRHFRRWISWKPLEIEAWFQRTTNRRDLRGIEWSRDRKRDVTPKGQVVTAIRLKPNISKTLGKWRCYLATIANYPGPSYKPTGINWILSMYGANDASCTSDGTTSYLTMKSCIVPACSTSRTSFASEYWVSLGTSPAMYQQTRSYKSAPSRGMVSGLHRSGDAPVADRRPPGPTSSAATRV